MAGPLSGLRIIEFTGLGPGPFCGMMLADHGAEVICVDRLGAFPFPGGVVNRSKKSIALNMKSPAGVAIARDLCQSADGAIEGFRPGVMERIGLGPDVLLKDNPKLVFGRMTGWGQTGPLAQAAGHDINYIALSGALHTCGRRDGPPTPPVNYLGDFGGGGMMLAFGMVCALMAVKNGAAGQVVDCAMTDGSATLTALVWSMLGAGMWNDERGSNLIDTGSHFYDVYETKDGKWVSIGSIEPQFYALLCEKAGLNDQDFGNQDDRSQWPAQKEKLAAIFKIKTRDEWCRLMEGTDVCFAPVLSMEEAPSHPHNVARDTFITIDGVVQPAPAPRYSETISDKPSSAPAIGGDGAALLKELGRNDAAIDQLRTDGVIA
ncbi:MAG: CaiB/BaiF CoA-transferase family protein [Pseudomonadota bacterium]